MKTPWKIQIEWEGETKIFYTRIRQMVRCNALEKIQLENGTEWPLENIVKINDIAFWA